MKNAILVCFLSLTCLSFANSKNDASSKKNSSKKVAPVKAKKNDSKPSLCEIRKRRTSIGGGGTRVIWVAIDCQTGQMRQL